MNRRLIDLAIIISSITIISCLAAENLQTQEEEDFPLIIEYIDSFSINPDDLSILLASQFHSIQIGSVSTADYEILNSKIISRYLGTSKNVKNITPFEINVEKDSFDLNIIFQIKVFRAALSKTYNCSVKTSQIMMDYTKSVDYKSGGVIITNYHNNFQSNSFEPLNCSNIVSKDEKSLNQAVNSTKNPSIYLQLNKHMSKITDYFAYNSKKQRLSQIYEDNPYSYDYYGFKIDINVETLKLESFDEQGLQNSMAGTIVGTSHKATSSPEYLPEYNTFYSIQFIQNFIQYVKDSYPAWENIKLNRNNMRISIFKFRLIDFEYIIPQILNRYPKFYLSDVSVQCSIAGLQDTSLDEKWLYQDIMWNCLGSFEPNTTKVTFLDFTVGLRHTVSIDASSGAYITVRVHNIQMKSLSFEYIEDFKVVDPFIAAQFITQGLFQFQVITVGTFFKIRSQMKQVKHVPGVGIWIG